MYEPELMRTWTDNQFRVELFDAHRVEGGKYVVSYKFFDETHSPDLPLVGPVAWQVGMGTAIDADAVVAHCLTLALDCILRIIPDYSRQDELKAVVDEMKDPTHGPLYWRKWHEANPDE